MRKCFIFGSLPVTSTPPPSPRQGGGASDSRRRLLAAKDRGIACRKLIEARRPASQQGLGDGRDQRLLTLAPLGEQLGERLGQVGRHAGRELGFLGIFGRDVDVSDALSG